MYIYLDESYNLKDRDKKQFVSINGFAVLDLKPVFKEWKKFRHRFAQKGRRIHANERYFANLRPKVQYLMERNDMIILSVIQILQEVNAVQGRSYWLKGKLDFDRLYYDLLENLALRMNLQEYRQINFVLDSRKHKGGVLAQALFEKKFITFLQTNFSESALTVKSQPSTTDPLLELADFISNILYREYINDNEVFFKDARFNLIQLKNPLK